ncbi:MAG: zinc ribbon domain-containing protein [Candidatus Peregrinibacteria bacterium]
MTFRIFVATVMAAVFTSLFLFSTLVAPPPLLVEAVDEIHLAQEGLKKAAPEPTWYEQIWGGVTVVWDTGGDMITEGVGTTTEKTAEKAVWWVILKIIPLWAVDSWITIHRDPWGILLIPPPGEFAAMILLGFWLAFALRQPPVVQKAGKVVNEEWQEWHYVLPFLAIAIARGTVGVVGALWPDAFWLLVALPALVLAGIASRHRAWWLALRIAKRRGWRQMVKHLAYEQGDKPPPEVAPEEEDEPEKVYCGHCGRENLPDAVVCGHCGQRVTAAQVAPQLAPQRATPPNGGPSTTPDATTGRRRGNI